MYSRFTKQQEPVLQLPQNYSGCAFSPDLTPQSPFIPPDPPLSPSQNSLSPAEGASTSELTETASAEAGGFSADPSSSNPLRLWNFENDDLFLIGLIFLFSDSPSNREILLCLSLLLFCK